MLRLYLVNALVLGLCLLTCAQRDKIFVLESPEGDFERKMVVTWAAEGDDSTDGCEIFTNQALINEVVRASDNEIVRKTSSEEMSELLEECSTFTLKRRRRSASEEEKAEPMEARKKTTTQAPDATTDGGYDGWNVIFPGTKWCGAGDIAKNYDDLGLHQDTDRCCRAHDHCDDLMGPGETKNNLTNTSPFTKLSCKCDHDFYDCLDRINTVTSNTIGNTYFNVLARTCYAKDYPLTKKCKKYRTFLKLTCLEYERDKSKPMVYDWVSARKYKKLPFPGPLTITLPF